MGIGVILLGVLLLFGAWKALKGMFASREQLFGMSRVIGTENPVVARTVCWIGFIPFSLGGIGMVVVGTFMLRDFFK